MKLNRVKFNGLKNRNGVYPLAATNAIVGANRSGKTTVRDAIFLAIFGNHPECAKTNQGIMKLAGGPSLMVEAEFDDGATIRRTWTTNSKGSVTAKSEGPEPNLDICGFAPSQFLAKGAKDRIAYLTGMGDPHAITEKISDFAVSVPEIADLDAVLDEPDCTPAGALANIEGRVVDARKEAKRELDRIKKALQEHLAGEPPNVKPDPSMSAARALELRGIAQHKAKMAREAHKGALEAQVKLAQRASLSPGATPNPERLAALQQIKAVSDATKRERRRLGAEIQDLEGSLTPVEVIEETQAALAAWEALKEEVITPGELATLCTKAHQLETRCEVLKAEVDRLEAAQEGHKAATDATLANKVCPTCGCEGQTWKNSYIDKREEELAVIVKDYLKARETFLEAAGEYAKTREEVAKHEAIVDRAFQASKWRGTIEEAKAIEAQLAEARKAFAELAPAITPAEEGELVTLAEAAKQEPAPTQAELEAAAALVVKTAGDVGAADAEAEQANSIVYRVTEIEDGVRLFEGWQQNREAMTKRLEAAEKHLAAMVGHCDRLATLKREITRETWAPITGTVSAILQEVFDNTSLQAVAPSESEFGIQDANGYRDFEVCSGAEQTVMAAAIGVALAEKAPVPVAIIDELSRLDASSRRAFQNTAANLFGGKVQQVIVLDHNPEGYSIFEKTITLD